MGRKTRSHEDIISMYAGIIRETYINCRQRYETIYSGSNKVSTYRPGPKWDNPTAGRGEITRRTFWEKLAIRLIDLKVSPELFVIAQFEARQAFSRPPWPNQLLQEGALESYKEHCRQTERDVAAELRRQLDAIKQHCRMCRQRGMARESAWLDAILEPKLQVSALIRYCFACHCYKLVKEQVTAGNVRIKSVLLTQRRQLREEAFAQYFPRRDVYDQHWGDMIPAKLKEEAKKTATLLSQ